MLNRFQILSITHREMNSEQRQRFGISRSDNSDFLRKIITYSLFDAFSVLYTSNRLEFHCIACSINKLTVCTEIARHLDHTEYIDIVNQLMKFNHYVGEDAIRHLLRVGCGLDSENIGEKHIASQLRKSLSDSIKINKSKFLHRLTNYIVRQSNLIRKQSGLDSEQKSIAGLLLEFINQDCKNPNILFLGLNNHTQTLAIKMHEKLFRNISIITNDNLRVNSALEPYTNRELSCSDYDVIIHSAGEIPNIEVFKSLKLLITFDDQFAFNNNNFQLITKQDIDEIMLKQTSQILDYALNAENIISNLTIEHQLFFS